MCMSIKYYLYVLHLFYKFVNDYDFSIIIVYVYVWYHVNGDVTIILFLNDDDDYSITYCIHVYIQYVYSHTYNNFVIISYRFNMNYVSHKNMFLLTSSFFFVCYPSSYYR